MPIRMNDLAEIGHDTAGGAARVAVVKAADEHVLDSLVRATKEGMVRPVLIDDAAAIESVLAGRLDTGEYDVVDVANDVQAAKEGVRLVREGKADALMKGHVSSGTFLKPVVDKETGIRTSPVLSHVMLVDNPAVGRIVAITDGGMVTVPREQDMMPIVEHAVQVMRLLGEEHPKVALMSAAESVIPRLPSAELQDAFAKEHAGGDLVIEGPISVDLALLPENAADKGWKGSIQGDASVVVAPDIVSGNAFAKALGMFGGGQMAGVVLGAAAPIVLVSRSSSAEEKYLALVLARIVGGGR